MRRVLPLLGLVLLLGLAFPVAAQSPFRPVETPAEIARLSATPVRATALRPFFFDALLFADAVKDVATERTDEVGTPSTLLELPHPDGGLSLFRVIESPVMAPELAVKFPEIRTFRGEGVDDPTASVRFELSPRGFSAMVLSAFGAWYVEPWSRENRAYVASFHRRDALRDPQSPFACLGPDARDGGEVPVVRSEGPGLGPAPFPLASVGPTLRTYRLALATTGEYSEAVCGANPTKPCVAAELVVAVNRVTGIYEREVAVRMTLVANNDLLIYIVPRPYTTDPYTNDDGGAMLGENQSNLDAVIGSANYDFGHVFSTGGGGVAYLRVICSPSSKAGGVTGSPNPTGDAFWVDYVAHEMGHQFGGNHTFNGKQGSCNGNRASSAAYEPGSGSTIMAYAGICGSQDLQPHSDPYFHGKSFDEIVAHVTTGGGASCAASTATSNSAPTVEAGAAYTIPSQTPFALTGSATDPESDPLTFGWEEFDLGTIETAPPLVDDGSRPIFRSFDPTVGPTRVFPKLADVLTGTTTYGETMPTTTRTMTFRLTARDNRGGGGGVNSDTTTVASVSTAGPFVITAPASAVSWPAALDADRHLERRGNEPRADLLRERRDLPLDGQRCLLPGDAPRLDPERRLAGRHSPEHADLWRNGPREGRVRRECLLRDLPAVVHDLGAPAPADGVGHRSRVGHDPGRDVRDDHRNEPHRRHRGGVRRHGGHVVHGDFGDPDHGDDPRARGGSRRRRRHEPGRRPGNASGGLHVRRRADGFRLLHGHALPGRRYAERRWAVRRPRPRSVAGRAGVRTRGFVRRPGRRKGRLDQRHRDRRNGGWEPSDLSDRRDASRRHDDLLRGRKDEGQQLPAPSLGNWECGTHHREERLARPRPPHRRRKRLLPVALPLTAPGIPAAPPA